MQLIKFDIFNPYLGLPLLCLIIFRFKYCFLVLFGTSQHYKCSQLT